MSYYVYSTLSQDNQYVFYHPAKNLGGKPVAAPQAVAHRVLIKGGTGIIDKNFITKKGVMTKITDEEYEMLVGKDVKDENSGNYSFKQHVKNGFIHVDTVKVKASNVAKDMAPRDLSAVATLEEIHQRGAPEAKPKE